MKQVLNGFLDCYYLTEDGRLYNSNNNKYTNCDKFHKFYIKTKDNKGKRITLKKLYKLVYDDNFCVDSISNLEGEQWRPIDNNNMYWCSNLGRIKSCIGYESLLLSPYTTKDGYLRVDLYINKERFPRLVHRIVASVWLPQPPSIDCCIHHISQQKQDNRACNLQWLTPVEHRAIHKKLKEQAETEKNV